jgi:hypothetical protein
MILTSREADPLIVHALTTGGVISDDVAQTIADGLKSPVAVDAPVCALAHGLAFEPAALVHRVAALIRSDEFRATDVLPELHALREWALCRTPHIVVEEYEVTGDDWSAWMDECQASRGEGLAPERERPEGARLVDSDVTLIADVCTDMSEWVYPGDARYPDDPGAFGPNDLDPEGDGVWVPAELVGGAAGLLSGESAGFYAESYGGDPFDPDPYWWQSGSVEELGVGRAYACRYQNPHSGEVQVRVARFVGLTDDQLRAVWHAWSGR